MRRELRSVHVALAAALAGACNVVFGVEPRTDGGGGASDGAAACPGTRVTVTIDPLRIVSAGAQFEAVEPDPIAPADQQHQVVLPGGEVIPTELDSTGATLRFCLPPGATQYRLRAILGAGAAPRDVITRAPQLRLSRIEHGRADAAPATAPRTLRIQVPSAPPSAETVLIRTTGVPALYAHPGLVTGPLDASIWPALRHVDNQARLLDGTRGDQVVFLGYGDNTGPPPNRTLHRVSRSSELDMVSNADTIVIMDALDLTSFATVDAPIDGALLAAMRSGLPSAGRSLSSQVAVRGFVAAERTLAAEVLLGYTLPTSVGKTRLRFPNPMSISPDMVPMVHGSTALTRRFQLGARFVDLSDSASMFLGLTDPAATPAPVVTARFTAIQPIADGGDAIGLDPSQPQLVEVTGFEGPGADDSLILMVLELVDGSLATELTTRLVFSLGTVEPTTSVTVPAGVMQRGGYYVVVAGARTGLTGPASGDWTTLNYPYAQTLTTGGVFRVP